MLVAQDRPHVDHFARQADSRWVLIDFSGLEVNVEFTSLDCQITMADLYAGVEFDD